MSDARTPPVGPVPPVGGTPAVEPVRPERPPVAPRDPQVAAGKHDVAAITGGNLPGQYAQLVINPDTHDVVIRVLDAQTHHVIDEYPSSAVEHMAVYLKQYGEMLARRHAAQRNGKEPI